MSKLRDPYICPDCRARLDSEATCTGCGLRLTGPLAAQLWSTMTHADDLVEELRRQPVTAAPVAPPASAEVSTGVTPGVSAGVSTGVSAGLPAAPPVAPVPPRRMKAGSVPALLFGVGALCLLIAAVVFVAVAWGSLSLGAKTTILLAVTATFGGLAVRMTRRGLRGAAETFWLVTAALVALDLGAAYDAGLLGYDALEPRYAVAVLGLAQAILGLGAAVVARRSELRFLVTATIASTAGALLLAASLAWSAPGEPVETALSIPVLAAAAAVVVRSGLRPAGYGVVGVAVVSWLALLLDGLAASSVPPEDWWLGADCWPVLVAAVFAGAATALRLDDAARVTAATGSVTALLLAVLAPPYADDTVLVLAAACTVVLTGASLLLPRVWALPSGGYGALGVLGLLVLTVGRPLVEATTREQEFAAWTAVVVAAAVAGATGLAVRWVADPAVREPAGRTWLVLGPTLVALGVATAVLESEPSSRVAVLAWTGVLAVLAALAAVIRGAAAIPVLLATGYLIAVDLLLADPSHRYLALVALASAAGLATAYRITAVGAGPRSVLAAATVGLTGLGVVHAVYDLGGDGNGAALALVAVAVVIGLLAVPLTRSAVERAVVEVAALACGLIAVSLPLDDLLAVTVLTITGTAVALVSVLHSDRDQVAWLGAVLLGAAALGRVDLGEPFPELATAPAAALLLVAGVRRLLTDPDVSSMRALGSGLSLALLPTLLLALDEPISARSVVVGVLALLALSAGVERRWAAPFLAGAGSLALLAIRHLAPVAEAVPRWVSFGLVGVALLAVAVTWESRRRDLATAERYLVGLR